MSEPVVRAQGVEVHEIPDGYIIDQVDRDRVHDLKRIRAVNLECDGLLRADEIVTRVANVFELAPSACQDMRTRLESLKSEGLLQ